MNMNKQHDWLFRTAFWTGGALLAASVSLNSISWAGLSVQDQQNFQQQSGLQIQHLTDPMSGKPSEIQPAEQNQDIHKINPPTPTVQNELPKPRLDESLKRKLLIKELRVEGVTKLSQAEVQAIIRPYEGKESSFLDLQDNVADKLTALYEKKGYITALAYIPPQKIENGILIIRADEGRVSKISLENSRWFKSIAVMPHVSLKDGQPFNVVPLENSLRRINENPDLMLQATLKAGKEPGDTEVVLEPKEENFFLHVTPFIDNMGLPLLGSNRYGVTISDNNTTGLGDTSFTSPYWTRRSFGIISGYSLPLGAHGTKIGFTSAHTGFSFKEQGVMLNGVSNINTPYLSQELFRNEHAILSAELGFAIKNSNFTIDHVMNTQDKIRVLTPALNFQAFDPWGRTLMRHEFAYGLNMAGATGRNDSLSSRPGASANFFRYTASISRLQKLPFGTYGIFKFQGQATPDRLFSLEQMQIGGAATVRGYQEGRLIGDEGFALSAEWRIPLKFLPESLKIGRYKLNENLEFVTFFDAGGVFDSHSVSGVNSPSTSLQNHDYLAGTGCGLRVNITQFLAGRIDVGIPLIRQEPDRKSAVVHFGVESRLF